MLINQWLPAAHRGDAIGDSARRVRDLLRAMGHDGHIYALTIDDDMRDQVRPFDDISARGGDVTVLHYALPSPMTAAFTSLPGRRVLQYHNITPRTFFRARIIPRFSGSPRSGVRIWPAWSATSTWRWATPSTTARNSSASGSGQPACCPSPSISTRITSAPPHPVLERLLGDGLTNFLFVGRIVPNKRIEDIVRLAEMYKRHIDANYRFIFVGRTDGMPRYYATVRALVAELDMLPERFVFAGQVPDWELAAYYRTASVYLSLSEHEGFCVPLLEAMAADVPVFAYESSAVGDTLGGAGVCWSPKDLEYAAELLGQLAFDPVMRQKVIAGQRRRLNDFSEIGSSSA